MINYTRTYTIITLLILVTLNLKSQGLIINEFSNGPSGSQEWVELLVLPDSTTPLANIDLTDWILDDNGGNFEGSTSGVGIADGHIKFGTAFNSIPPGSLIVIYFNGNKSPNIPLDDPYDANNDSVYILAGNHSSLASCSTVPAIGTFSYSCSPVTADWSYISMRNGGDAVQIRTPLNKLFHGYSYGDVTAPFPLFPSSVSSWNIGSGNTGFAYPFDCGNWELQTSFSEINETASTPGSPNSSNNQNFITRIRTGNFDYNDLSSSCNPVTVTPPAPNTTPQNPIITIPNVFSPNGDGTNDVFIIDSLLYYPTKVLTIYNRWGNVVYEDNDYQNNWGGANMDGTPLNTGTYYYILDIGEEKKRVGFLSLFRD